ncbi:hypothetical protein L2E82_01890 [Cichorium intybus]|uniref:Uncharacterized protein n=1 Tax=Cichorium intybus TaxID=13427 RepID=A0ACB9H0X6_CICIN|nr:hypothetical protein L2E82_01890 [Cichorium intybus]
MGKLDDISAISNFNQDKAWVIDSIKNAMPPSSSARNRIPRVPDALLREMTDYDKYYVPKAVSIGPYHHGKPELESVEKLKPFFTTALLCEYRVDLGSLYTYRSIKQLSSVGIHFKSSGVMSLADVKFDRRWWWLSADVKLPSIIIDDSTKTMLLNLTAYERCTNDARKWVASYICLLDSLIDDLEDVPALRKAGVLDISFGSDKEVAKLFNEIATDLYQRNKTSEMEFIAKLCSIAVKTSAQCFLAVLIQDHQTP